MLPGLIRHGLGTVEPGGSLSVVITVTRTDDPDPGIRLQIVLTPSDSTECESLVAEMTGPMRGPGARNLRLDDDDRAFLNRAVGQVLLHLDDHDLDVARLARALHTSVSQLQRRLRTLVDRSPAEMIRLVRLLRARELIDDERVSLSSIAYACGFSDQAHFSRTYRRYFGAAPSERRTWLRGQGFADPGGVPAP